MSAETCYSQHELSDYLLGNLPDAASEGITVHLESCRSCEEAVALLDGTEDPLISRLRAPAEIDDFQDDTIYRGALNRVQELVAGNPDSASYADSPDVEPVLGSPHPERLREYRLLEKLGEGGMGTVYKAEHTRLGRVVALKVLSAARTRDAQALSRFEREIRAVGQIAHPGIVLGTDAGETDGTHFLVMEYVEGMDLGRLVRRCGPLPIPDACELVRQAALALHHAHQEQLVHRDVKPSNLMLKPDGSVKVLDLGLALLAELDEQAAELTTTGQFVGTLDYVAPEQCDDSHDVDHRVDIYSLGATLYKLLCAEAPYERSGANSPLQRIKRWATLPIPPIGERRVDVPEKLAQVIERMIAKGASDRFSTAAEVAEALAEFVTGCNLPKLLKRAEQRPEKALSPARTGNALAVVAAPRTVSVDPTHRRPSFIKRGSLLAMSALLVLAAGYAVVIVTDRGKLVIETNDPDVEVVITRSGEFYDEMQLVPGRNETSVRSGEYEVTLKGESDSLQIENGSVKLTRGKEEVVKITRQQSVVVGTRGASDTELAEDAPRYNGKTFGEWLSVAHTERNPDQVLAAIKAIEALHDEATEREAARAILQIMSRYEKGTGHVGSESLRVFRRFQSTKRIEDLVDILATGNAYQRMFALHALDPGNGPDDPTTSAFEDALHAQSERIVDAALPVIAKGVRTERRSAISLVARLQPDSRVVKDALWQALGSDDPHVAVDAAGWLVHIGGDPEKLLPVLRKLATVNDQSMRGWPQTPISAVVFIGRLESKSDRVVSLLAEIISDPKSAWHGKKNGTGPWPSARAAAIEVLGELGEKAESAIPLIKQYLSDDDLGVAQQAKAALAKISPPNATTGRGGRRSEPSADASAVYNGRTVDEWLAIAQTERNPSQVNDAVKALGELSSEMSEPQATEATRAFLAIAARYPTTDLYTQAALGAFARQKSPDRVTDLLRTLETGNQNQRLFAIQLLDPNMWVVEGSSTPVGRAIQNRKAEIANAALKVIETGERADRIKAIGLIEKLQHESPAADDVLWRVLDGTDRHVASAAAGLLAGRKGSASKLLPVLRKLADLNETCWGPTVSYNIAAHATWQIYRLADESDQVVETLVEIVQRPESGWRPVHIMRALPSARETALVALGELGERAKPAIPVIEEYLSDDDRTVARNAKAALAKISPPADTTSLDPDRTTSIEPAVYDGRTFDAWLKLIDTEKKAERLGEAIHALGVLKPEGRKGEVLRAIFDVLQHEIEVAHHVQVVHAVAHTLRKVDAQTLADALLAELQREDASPKLSVLRLMESATYFDKERIRSRQDEILAALLQATSDETSSVRGLAITGAAFFAPKDEALKARLLDMLNKDKAEAVIYRCLDALANVKLQADPVVRSLAQLAEHPSPSIRAKVAQELATLARNDTDISPAIPGLIRLLDDEESGSGKPRDSETTAGPTPIIPVALEALRALNEAGRDAAEALPKIEEILKEQADGRRTFLYRPALDAYRAISGKKHRADSKQAPVNRT